jgi:hypothetical protein
MTHDPTRHPSLDALRRLASGQAAAPEAREVVRHLLAGCDSCSRAARDTQVRRDEPALWSYDEVFERLKHRMSTGAFDAAAQARAAAAEPGAAHELYAEMLAHEAVDGLMQVQSTRRYATLALCELLLRKALGGQEDAAAAPPVGRGGTALARGAALVAAGQSAGAAPGNPRFAAANGAAGAAGTARVRGAGAKAAGDAGSAHGSPGGGGGMAGAAHTVAGGSGAAGAIDAIDAIDDASGASAGAFSATAGGGPGFAATAGALAQAAVAAALAAGGEGSGAHAADLADAGDSLAARCIAAAAKVCELLDLEPYGAPVVQDVRAIAWTYFTDPCRIHEDARTALVSRRLAGRLLAAGAAPGERAETLAVQAALAAQCGEFDVALRLLRGAAGVARRGGRRHLLGRVLVKRGTALGNTGRTAAAVRLLWQGIDLIEGAREPRLLVCATHNLAWFLHESGRTGQAGSCLDAARRLYRSARDRRELSRLRWLEGKLATDFHAAESALQEARDGLAREGLGYEAALATMDLAVRYAAARRGAEMRRCADAMVPLFRSGDMYGGTVLALQSFQRYGGGADPAGLLRNLNTYLHRARLPQNPPALAAAMAS